MMKDGKLEIDGVEYKKASKSELQAIASRHPSSASLAVTSLVGSWSYVDSDGVLDMLTITLRHPQSFTAFDSRQSPGVCSCPCCCLGFDLVFTITREWMMEFKDENLKCRVRENNILVDITDARQPTVLSARVTPSGSRDPIASAKNTDNQYNVPVM